MPGMHTAVCAACRAGYIYGGIIVCTCRGPDGGGNVSFIMQIRCCFDCLRDLGDFYTVPKRISYLWQCYIFEALIYFKIGNFSISETF